TALFDGLNALFQRFDLLALPSAQVFAFDVERPWPDVVAGRTMDTYHRWMEVVIYATLVGSPVISVAVGFEPAARVLGMRLMGPPRRDREVLAASLPFEKATGGAGLRLPEVGRVAGG